MLQDNVFLNMKLCLVEDLTLVYQAICLLLQVRVLYFSVFSMCFFQVFSVCLVTLRMFSILCPQNLGKL